MNAEFWVAFATGFVALVALITSSAGAAKARVKTIEDAYIARYWQILDRFPAQALVAEASTACTGEELKAVRLYLRLCEDELELRQLGWVGRTTWQQFPGIQAQLNQWPWHPNGPSSAMASAHPTGRVLHRGGRLLGGDLLLQLMDAVCCLGHCFPGPIAER